MRRISPDRLPPRRLAVALCAVLALAGCAVGSAGGAGDSTVAAPSLTSVTPTNTAPRPAGPTASAPPASIGSPSPRAQPPTPSATPAVTPRRAPVIVIDPGHSRTVAAIDPRTGLDVSDYENEPEMRDVFEVARLVSRTLRAAGYRVVLTKTRLDQRRNLAQRAQTANAAHAALALSIHDQAGPDGGIGFDAGNNIVYYQSVGSYRQTPAGKKVVFTGRRVAALSKKYATIFAAARRRAQGVPIRVQGNVGYDLGTRGLAPGDIWTVQLLSHVPWIYNEAGGNSPGRSGLDATDLRRYAAGLSAAVEGCLPLAGPSS